MQAAVFKKIKKKGITGVGLHSGGRIAASENRKSSRAGE
jgi:hypothetical protein